MTGPLKINRFVFGGKGTCKVLSLCEVIKQNLVCSGGIQIRNNLQVNYCGSRVYALMVNLHNRLSFDLDKKNKIVYNS